MKIDRTPLLEKLQEFVQTDHGVVIGKPGIGKTHILRELKRTLVERKILSFIIKVDTLLDASDEEIERQLHVENWIETFKKIEVTEHKGILIFDAFDAARDENLRSKFLSLISRTRRELSKKWNVIVSVRTYDAIKSPDLIRLFPSNKQIRSVVNCRSFEIPKLDDSEIESALQGQQSLQRIYTECTDELREVLRTPYFLGLLEKVLEIDLAESQVSELKAIKSETQLLSKFWQSKITATNKSIAIEKFLTDFTVKLVTDKVLAISKIDLFNILGDDFSIFDYLRSENILEEFSVTNNRIGYSHNILFDYAVCKICLSDDISKLISFIREDVTRPFFLRPSFIYFFTHLWYDGREIFWSIYWNFYDIDERDIQLSLRLIPNTIIASEFSSIKDFKDILTIHNPSKRNSVLKQVFQSIIFLRQNKPEERDIKLIHRLAGCLSVVFLWELSFVLQKAIENQSKFPELKNELGLSARNLFKYILDARNNLETFNKGALDRLGSSRGIPLICLTYSTDTSASRQLLESVLTFLNEPDFDIWYFSILCDKLDLITPSDPSFVAKVYLMVFGHKETSEAQTSMGGGVALNLLSNRRQDFEMCNYRLLEYYPSFLENSPAIAIQIGLEIVNTFTIENKNYDLREYKFKIGNSDCIFISDLSYWDQGNDYHSPTKIVSDIVALFEKLICLKQDFRLNELLSVYFNHAKVAMVWKKIIELGNKYPEQLQEQLFPLAIERIILESGETVYEISNFIGQITSRSICSKEQVYQIESIVLSILDTTIAGLTTQEESKKSRVSRILNKIPRELLQHKRSLEFLTQYKIVPNEPLVKSYSSVEQVTTESWLEDTGVEVRLPVNAMILNKAKQISGFNYQWQNGMPDRSIYSEYLDYANSLFNILKENFQNADRKVIDSALTDLAKTYVIVCRNITTLTTEELEVIKSNILFCFNFKSEFDEEIDENLSPASGYSPTPRIEASEALPLLVSVDYSDSLITIYQDAVNDTNPIVRFNSIRYLYSIKKRYPIQYWTITFDRLKKEPDSFTAAVLLNYFDTSDESKTFVDTALQIANSRKELIFYRSSFADHYVYWLLVLAINKNQTAIDLITENISSPILARQLIFKLFDFIDPGNPENDYTKSNSQNDYLFNLFNNILSHYGKNLKSLDNSELQIEQPEVKDAIDLYDTAVQQVYFALALRGEARQRERSPVLNDNRVAFYFRIKSSLELILNVAQSTTTDGMLIPHTAYYFSQILNGMLSYDPRDVLAMTLEITKYSFKVGYTFDSSSIEQIVNLTEKIFADHRSLLLEKVFFDNLIELLDLYVQSGWTSALELLSKLDDIFR